MKLETAKFGKQAVSTTDSTIKMRFDENAMPAIFSMFTEKIYSNPIGTIVREITSNAFDSHIEANVNKPVLIKLTKDKHTELHYISFIDFGVGMSPERVNSVYSVYMKSTKNSDNTQIGGFGLGGKTPLAYRRYIKGLDEYDNSFNVITIHNGIKYYYLVHEGENEPMVTLFHTEETTEHNGTEVKIQVLQNDINKFVRELKLQLFYFENIVFEGFNDYNYNLNDYQILNAKTFLYRDNTYSRNIHICLGRVAYPIDFNALGLNTYEYEVPVAIKLNIGDIEVTPSRESLKYTEATVKFLKEKIGEVKKEITEIANKYASNVRTLNEYYDFKGDFQNLTLSDKHELYITNHFLSFNDLKLINFKYDGLYIPSKATVFNALFKVKDFGTNKMLKNRLSTNGILSTDILKNYHIFYVEDEFKRVLKKQQYLNSLCDAFHVLTKKDINVYLDNLLILFKVNESERNTFSKQIVEIQNEIMDIVRTDCSNYDTLVVPKTFVAERANKKIENEFNVKFKTNSYSSSYYKMTTKQLKEYNGIVFYGFRDDEYKFNNATPIIRYLFDDVELVRNFYYNRPINYNNKKSIMFIEIAKNNEQHMKFAKKAYHIDYIYEKLFYRKLDSVMYSLNLVDADIKYDSINRLFLRSDFNLVNPQLSKMVSEVKMDVERMFKLRTKDIDYCMHEVKRYYEDIAEKSKDILSLEKKIDKILEIQKKNVNRLNLLNISRYTEFDSEVVDVLKRVLIF